MNVERDAGAIGRMIIALDATICDAVDVEAAAEIAQHLGTALHALFVEDPDLAALAQLPVAREVARVGARARPLDRDAVASAVRRRVERASGALARMGEERMLAVTYSTERGKVLRQALACGAAGEIVVLPQSSAQVRSARAPARATRAAPLARPVMAWYDPSPGAARALALAERIARHVGGGLFVGYHEADSTSGEMLRRFVHDTLASGGGPVWLRPIAEPHMQALAQALRALRAGQFVLSVSGPFAEEDTLAMLIAQASSSVILVHE